MKRSKLDPVIVILSFLLVVISTQVWSYPEISFEYKLLVNAFSLVIVLTVLGSQYLLYKMVNLKG